VQFPIIIGLHRSRFLDAMLLSAVILACAAILSFDGAPPVRAGLVLVVTLQAIQAWRALTPVIGSIRLERSGDIFVARVGQNDFVLATLKPGATIHPWLTVIRLVTADGCPATIIATVDRKNSENLRRLRMFMRWQAKFSEITDDA
jgi:toxin CptA